MVVSCQSKTPWYFCEEMEKVVPKNGGRIVRRPFNHYEPQTTNWWLVPSVSLPFYKFSKYYFVWDERDRSEIRCGYHVSKGMDPLLKSVFSSAKGKRLLMNDTWGWHNFQATLSDGRFEEMIRRGAEAQEREVELIFDGGYIDDPGIFDGQGGLGRRRDVYHLRYEPKSGKLGLVGAKRDAMILKFLNKVRDWKSFHEAMATLNADQFMWCDCFFATNYKISSADDPSSSTAQTIYDSWLSNFRELIVT